MSAFQQYVRGDCTLLTDHISKQMNELNLERCRWVLGRAVDRAVDRAWT